MKKDITITVIAVILAYPAMLIWHAIKGTRAGFNAFIEEEKEWWSLVMEDFK